MTTSENQAIDVALARLRTIIISGSYDLLAKQKNEPNTGDSSVVFELVQWVNSASIPVFRREWNDSELDAAKRYLTALASLREIDVQRPDLVDEITSIKNVWAIRPVPRTIPDSETAPEVNVAQGTSFTKELIAVDALFGAAVEQRDLIKLANDFEFAELDSRVELIAQAVLADHWEILHSYSMLATPREVIRHLLQRMLNLDAMVTRAERWIVNVYVHKGDSKKTAALIGVRALLSLTVGRLMRAIAEGSPRHAEERLTQALELYELRVTERTNLPKADSIAFSQNRSANALLALSYLSTLNATPTAAAARLKTAKLLAVSSNDAVLENELNIVEFTIRRLQLVRSGVSSEGVQKEEARIRDGLKDCRDFDLSHKRPYFAAMSMFQIAQLYADNTVDNTLSGTLATECADEILAISRSDQSSYFWEASAQLLKARIALRDALLSSSSAASVDLAASAIPFIERARRVIRERRGLRTLLPDCSIYEARSRMMVGDFVEARKLLHSREVSHRSVGLTTIPARTSFVRLLRSELNIRQGQFGHAWQQLARFEQHDMRKLQIGWLRDEYHRVRALAHGDSDVFVLTDDILAGDMAKDIEHRVYSYPKLIQSVEQFLCAATARIHGNKMPNDTELAKAWGLADRKMAARIRKRAQQHVQQNRRIKPPK